MYSPPEVQVTSVVELPKNEFGFVEPARIAAGGRMAEEWLIRTKSGASPTRWRPVGGGKFEELIDERWTKVTSLTEVENLYDLGFVNNVKDAMLRWRTAG